MKICIECLKEMPCVKTGVVLHFGHGHCYSADIFRCSKCGATIANSNETSYHLDDAKLRCLGDKLIEMEKGG